MGFGDGGFQCGLLLPVRWWNGHAYKVYRIKCINMRLIPIQVRGMEKKAVQLAMQSSSDLAYIDDHISAAPHKSLSICNEQLRSLLSQLNGRWTLFCRRKCPNQV